MDWQVTIAVELDGDFTVTDDHIDHLIDTLNPHGGSIGIPTADEPKRISTTLTVSSGARHAGLAAQDGYDLFAAALHRIGYAVTAWTEAEAITVEEADRRLDTPTIPELVSGVEAAAILGVSRQRVHQLSAGHSMFPTPVARLASGSVWLRAGVEGFARRWPRKVGRPAKVS